MNRFLLIPIFLIGFCTIASAQNFRTRQDGNWGDVNTWEEDADANGSFETVPASQTPTNAHGTINILNTHDVTVAATVSVDQVTVESGGTVTVNSGFQLRVRNGTGIDFTVNSGATLFVNGTFVTSGINGGGTTEIYGTCTNNQGGAFTSTNTLLLFKNGSTYNHNYTTTAGTIPTAGWESGSTCAIIGYTSNTSAPGGITQNFHHFTWNCTNQADIISINNNLTALGNVNFIATNFGGGGGAVIYNATTSSLNLTVTGSFSVTGDAYLLLTNDGSATTTLTCAGLTVNNASATFDLAELGTTVIDNSGDFTWSAGTFQATGGTCSMRFNGTSNQTFTATSAISGTINYTIRNSAIVSIGATSFLSGSGTFTIEASGTLNVASSHASGAIQSGTSNGNIRVGGSRTFNAGCTIGFNGSSAQVFGNGMPSDANININNASGVSIGGAYTLATSRTMTFNSGKLVIGSNTLTINGAVSGMSAANSFTGSTSSVISIGGSSGSAGTLFFDQTSDATRTLSSLTLNRNGGSATIGNTLRIQSTLTASDGTLNTGGFVILTSTSASHAAQFATYGSGATVSGGLVIQRFIPSRTRSWRFLAAPVTSGSGATIRNNWQAQTFITGGSGGTGPVGLANYNPDGFDFSINNSESMLFYNESAGGSFNTRWVSVGNPTTTNLVSGLGYRVFIRGDRSDAGRLDGSVTTQNALTLQVTGTPEKGPVTVSTSRFSAASDDGWNLLGNPFPATLDWNVFQTTNSAIIGTTYYALNVGGSGYVNWNGTTGGAGGYIASGQAFWVKKLAAGTANVTFNEAHKATSENGAGLFKSATLTNHLKVTMNNLQDSTEAYSFIHYRGDASNGADDYDAAKLGFGSNQLACYNNGSSTYLDINSKNTSALAAGDTINLYVHQPATNGNYSLLFEDQTTFPANTQLFLEDRFLSRITNLRNTSLYPFSTSASSSSTGANRFRILVSTSQSALPVVFKTFNAEKVEREVLLKWSTSSETNNSHFVIEKSSDNLHFSAIGQVKGNGSTTMTSNYSLVDTKPSMSGINYYRLKQVDFNGEYAYSPVMTVDFSEITPTFSSTSVNNLIVFPVPAQQNITVANQRGFTGEVVVKVYDIAGALVISETKVLNETIDLDVEHLRSGVYFVEMSDMNQTFTDKVKFIKQ